MPGAPVTTGFFGKIPATGDFVGAALPRVFVDRWDRWMSMELAARPDEGELDSRVWRFIVPAGIFGPEPCAGAWRMSEDRVGRRYPLVIAAVGATPSPRDIWFDRIAEYLAASVEAYWSTAKLADELAGLPTPAAGDKPGAIAFWCDDFDVTEFSFSDIHDLADNALPRMRAAKPAVEEI